MKSKLPIIILILISSCMNLSAQHSDEITFPESFRLGKQAFLKSLVFVPFHETHNVAGSNLMDNPGIIKDKKLIRDFVDDFDIDDINQIYYEIYADKHSIDEEIASVLVIEFNSEEALKRNMANLESFILPTRFTLDKYVIVVRSDDRTILEGISNFYVTHLGAIFYYPK